MHKHSILVLAMLLGLSLPVSAQEFDVRSFEADPSDVAASRYPRTTVNDERAALVKIVTNIDGMLFESNLGIVDVERKEAEYWVYVPPRERRIRLMAPSYIAKDINMPEPAQSNMVYQMVVATKGIAMPTTDLVQVTFRMNQENVSIQTNNRTAVLSTGSTSRHSLPRGTHSFRFIKQGFEELVVDLDLQEDQDVAIDLVPGEPETSLALPGFITVESEPSGATVFLNEQRVGATPYMGRQPAGAFTLMISHPMYHEHTEQFVLAEGETVNLPLAELTPRFGYYAVNTIPRGAEVQLNGRTIGTSPLARTEISSGEHELRIRMPLYHDHTETFIIEDGDDKNFNIELKEAFGQLFINSEPSGADVYVDGRRVGVTPYENLQKPSGSYVVRLTKDLHSDANEQVTVADGERTERLITLGRNFGTLDISADGADIFVEGERVGRNTWRGNMSPGRYSLRASKDLHADDERTVFVVVGETERVKLSPRPRLGALSIMSQPFETRGAQIYIDGERRRETTPASLSLLMGTYEVSVKKDGYLDATQRVEIREGREEELLFEMMTFEGSKLQEIGRRRTAKVIYGSATLAAVTAGGYFRYSAMQLADEYPTATKDAEDIYNRMEQHDLFSYVAFGVAVPMGVMMLLKSSEQRRLQREVDMAFVPVDGGGVFTLRIGF